MVNERRRIWIHPFQTALFVRIVVYFFVYLFIAAAFAAYCERIESFFTILGVRHHFLENAFVRSLLILIVLTAPMALESVYFTHRLVGPLHRFRKTMQAIAAGQPAAPIQLRKGDLLVEFQNDFNAMLAYLEQQGFVLSKSTDPSVVDEAPNEF